MMTTKQSKVPSAMQAGGKTPGVLVIDSDPGVRWSLERGLSRSGYRVVVASTAESAVSLAQDNGVSAILIEIMPEAGLTVEVLSRVISSCNATAIVCSSVDASPHIVTECVKRGTSSFLQRPFSLGEVRAELFRALAAAQDGAQALLQGGDAADQGPSLIVGVSQAVQELRTVVLQVARSNLNCLIRGDSGVGKDVVAREIHRLSPRNDRPFVKVNCTALPEPLLESELFGYEKGAFTGATTSKPGRFSLADQGIIFLDEICDMPMSIQAKLLQVTEQKQFTKLGGRAPLDVDVQILSASNAPFEQRLEDRSFRHDLFFRLNEICISVPPLAVRKEDIPLLAHHFVQKHGVNQTGQSPELSTADIEALCSWDWPGNVRELESAIKRWLALGKLQVGPDPHPNGRVYTANFSKQELPRKPDEPSLRRISEVLDECQWNRTKAARVLGLSYQSLRRRISQYNLA